MSACQEFCASPNTFLVHNEVYWRGGAPTDQDLIMARMSLVDGEQARIRTGSRFLGFGNAKASVPVYELKCFKGTNWTPRGHLTEGENFEAQWSGYKGGEARLAVLPATGGPSIMLTPQLTGCTIVCALQPDGGAIFAHYNLKDHGAPGTLDDATMKAIAEAQFGTPDAVLSKGKYRTISKRGGNLQVTVVGHRREGRWGFWAQYREDKVSGSQIRLVERLA